MSFTDDCVVIGHRGAAGLVPENTLPSFRRAYACGVSAVELDVYTVEGELVVIHDDTVDRTTNGTGAMSAQTLESLRSLDAGAGAGVPLLAEVVAELPAGIGLNVELKGPGTAIPLARFLSRHPNHDVLVSSFDHGLLERFRREDPDTRVAPLFGRWRVTAWRTAAELDAWAINLSRRAVTPARLEAARQRGLRSFVYTVNDLEDARALIALGASGIFTDFPDLITPDALGARARG
jgi:glycerophosphoryl diester phosphodiesterase